VNACTLLVVPTVRLVKVSELRESDTAVVPVPLRLMVWLPELTLSAMVNTALMEPVVAGVKVTVKAHDALAARLLPQLLD